MVDGAKRGGTGGRRGVPLQRYARNRILAALPPAELARFADSLEEVSLPQHTVLQETDVEIEHVYFLTSGVASLIASGSEGEQVDTAIIGAEGMVGLPVFLGTGRMPVRAEVQADVTAFRISADDLRAELERGGELVNVLQRYTQMVLIELAQLILCNRTHSIEHRCARWILQVAERLPKHVAFSMTQEFLAAMVASPRPHVAQILQQFRQRGLIDYGRGSMQLVDADGLERAACACYRTIRDELDRLLASRERYDITARA